jgi:hypothetical protein
MTFGTIFGREEEKRRFELAIRMKVTLIVDRNSRAATGTS